MVLEADGEMDWRAADWMVGGAKERRLGVERDEEEEDGRPP